MLKNFSRPALLRRRFSLALLSASCVSTMLLSAMPSAHAAAPMLNSQPAGYYKMMLGKFEVTALLDENSTWPSALEDLFPSLSAEEKASLAKRTHLQLPVDFSTIAFLVNTGSKLILIDAGGGKMDNYGQLFANLKAAGYAPEQIDDVFITHMHPDHVGGLSEAGQRLFPNAVVHADQRELPQYEAMAAKKNATGEKIVAKFAPYIAAKKFKTFDGNTEFYPGVRSIASYGHSDGHSFYAIESEGKKLLAWGDFVVNDKIQLEKVDVVPPGEKDKDAGIALHRKMYAEAAQQGYMIAAAHIGFPGIGRLRSIDKSYVFVPVDYAAMPTK